MSEEAREFAAWLREAVHDRLDQDPEWLARDAFVQIVGEFLIEDGALEDLQVCYYHGRDGQSRMEVAGYAVSDEGTQLDLVAVDYGRGGDVVTRDQVQKQLRWARNFVSACHQGLHRRLEETGASFDMAQTIHTRWADFARVRVFFVTDGRTTLEVVPDEELDGLATVVEVWDVERLRRLHTSGRREEAISIDLTALGHAVPALAASDTGDYRCLLAVLPGQLLADLYDRYGARLLQRNVRAFLQARGKVNRGINETVRLCPDRFLAYNNGISATATHVETDRGPDGGLIITRITDLQIVNGGQTTASLHHASRRDRADLSRVEVPAKITVVRPDQLDELVPRISRYANSQNRISESDFESTNPFHVELERLSRAVWAPATSGSTRQTHWYYERARGQYQDERGRLRTAARRRVFDRDNPRTQRFAMTDAARYETAYRQLPHVVCLGAQKCFQLWTVGVVADTVVPLDEQYYRDLVAKAILFEHTRREIRRLRLPGYLAQMTAYTVGLLVHHTGEDLDLGRIWRGQGLPSAVSTAVRDLAPVVRGVLVDSPEAGNITEWSKKEACWKRVLNLDWP